MFPRSSGILLHPTSLPGRFGIGELGPEAFRFIEFLSRARQSVWQVLPLGPTGYGDSPYQSFSAFAGNPLLISLEALCEEGLLSREELAGAPAFPGQAVDYAAVRAFKLPLLARAARPGRLRGEFEAFCAANAAWLDDYALFMSLKEVHGGEAVWTRWHPGIARREPAALEHWRRRLESRIECVRFEQFLFFRQWAAVSRACHASGIRVMGDLPIYVAHDSADVWAHPEYFRLDERGEPEAVSGVPPDYFSATGQLWGNPIYRWDALAADGYRWWIERFRSAFRLFDMLRVDHFRGFDGYWEVRAGETTAMKGRWVKGPGAALFRAVEEELGRLPIVAENLGVITPEVESLREQFGFPGMAVLQFAFGKDPQAPSFKPHNYTRNLAAYTGTHDNDTAVGWWNSTGEADSTRTVEDVVREKEYARDYLATDGREINWVLIRALMQSVADTVLFPLQDVLGLGSDARMNLPATSSGNWRWRFCWEMLEPTHAARLARMAELYDR